MHLVAFPTESRTLRAEPETLRARSSAVSLTVRDIDKSLAWYRDVLRFAVSDRQERGGRLDEATVVAGNARVVLKQDTGAKDSQRVWGERFQFHLATVQDVDELAVAIKKAGGRLAAEPTALSNGLRGFSIPDPDGLEIVVVESSE